MRRATFSQASVVFSDTGGAFSVLGGTSGVLSGTFSGGKRPFHRSGSSQKGETPRPFDRGVSKWGWELATLSFPVDGALAPGLSARRPSPRRCSPRQAEYSVSQQDRPTTFARAAY